MAVVFNKRYKETSNINPKFQRSPSTTASFDQVNQWQTRMNENQVCNSMSGNIFRLSLMDCPVQSVQSMMRQKINRNPCKKLMDSHFLVCFTVIDTLLMTSSNSS